MEGSKELSSHIGKLLSSKGKTLATAESCTGGYLAHLITLISGSSTYFMGGVIAYDNAIKVSHLNVSEETLKKFGAVSVECAKEMAAGVLKRFNVDFALSTTGIAGPTGEVPGKPIGTVWIGIATKENVIAEKFQFAGNRAEVIEQSAYKALEILHKTI